MQIEFGLNWTPGMVGKFLLIQPAANKVIVYGQTGLEIELSNPQTNDPKAIFIAANDVFLRNINFMNHTDLFKEFSQENRTEATVHGGGLYATGKDAIIFWGASAAYGPAKKEVMALLPELAKSRSGLSLTLYQPYS